MTVLQSYHQSLGAVLAEDGIPLHYGDLSKEYDTALESAIILDRSHEGRIILTGQNRFELVNRMSTNKIVDMPLHTSQATIFTNPNARILYRVMTYNRPEGLLIITEAGQDVQVANYLQRNIFYGDDVKQINVTAQTKQFAIHGSTADSILAVIHPDLENLDGIDSIEIEVNGATFTLIRRKSIINQHWAIVCQERDAVAIHQHLLEIGSPYGLQPAGSITYNTLRIRSGRPARAELSTDYIPLEVGLWDEVSFAKGCYTGQEIIARMESRQRLAKTIVKLSLDEFVQAPATLYSDGKSIGQLTSSVTAPNGTIFAIGVIKTDFAKAGTSLTVGEHHTLATVIAYAGEQPAFLLKSL